MAKKAISHFMPNQQHWVVEHNVGNPTKSTIVNQVIKNVKIAEVRRQGRASNAKRDMKRAEFKKTLRLLEDHRGLGSFDTASKFPAMMKLQFHIIGRTDDITNIETADLRSHSQFTDCAMQMKVSWSKNVLDERDCPDQLLLGAMDDDFCVMVALATYLESKLVGNANRFLFCDHDDEREPDRLNTRYYRILKAVWRNQDFIDLLRQTRGSVGTHSLRKFPATWCGEHGCTGTQVEIRGRWTSGRGRVVNRYVSPDQLPTDAKLAGILAVGGPVKYKLKSDTHVTSAFLRETVAPAMTAFFTDESNHIAELLALPLLYAAHVPALAHMMTDTVRNRIINGYRAIRQDHPVEFNPVHKVPLHVYQVENQVFIEELVGLPEEANAANAGNNPIYLNVNQAANRHDSNSILLSLNRIQQTQAQHHQQHVVSYIYVFSLLYIVTLYLTECICLLLSLQADMQQLRLYCSTQFQVINRNMTRYYAAPVRPIGRRTAAPMQPRAPVPRFTGVGAPPPIGQQPPAPQQPPRMQQQQQAPPVPPNAQGPPEGTDPTAKLARVRTLMELWNEWEHGHNGSKPARAYTEIERGLKCNKFKFSKRLNFWKVMRQLINRGHSDLTATDLIMQCYGRNKSVTYILEKLCVAKTEGYHPNLGLQTQQPNNRGARQRMRRTLVDV
jgi:hypothetical protein